MNDYKREIERVEYASGLIRELEKNLINLSNVFDEVKPVKNIRRIIDDFKGKLDFLLLDMDKFKSEYVKVANEIKMEIEKYRNELLQDLRANYSLEYSANREIFKKYKSIIDKTSNVFAIYSAYTSARKELEDCNKVIRVTPTYVGDKIEYLRRKYLGDIVQRNSDIRDDKLYIEINNLINSLIKGYNESDVLLFEADAKVVSKQIEDIIRKYYNKLFESLVDNRLFARFPGAKHAYQDQRVNNYNITCMSDAYDAYLSTKSLIENVVKKSITKNLVEVVYEFESRDNFEFIRKKIDKIIDAMLDNINLIIKKYSKSEYTEIFRKKVENCLIAYHLLVAKKNEKMKQLEKFSTNPVVWNFIGRLKKATDYDEVSLLIKKADDLIANLEEGLRIRQSEAVKNFINQRFMYLELKTQYMFIDIISEAIVILMNFQKGEDVDIEVLKNLSFSDIDEDRKIIRIAKRISDLEERSDEKFERLINIFTGNSNVNTKKDDSKELKTIFELFEDNNRNNSRR